VSTLTAATWVFALLLVVAGTGKIARRAGTSPLSDGRLTLLLGAGEIGLGGAVLLIGGPVATALLAATYAAFAGFAGHQRRRGGDCGCFPTATTTPPTMLHVWLNIIAATAAAGTALRSGASLATTIAADPPEGLLVVGLLGVAAGGLWLLLTAAPDLSAAAALVDPRDDA
jgi:hypothetical protein